MHRTNDTSNRALPEILKDERSGFILCDIIAHVTFGLKTYESKKLIGLTSSITQPREFHLVIPAVILFESACPIFI